jgi:uncharacterized protein YydD (DUF2326 family)
LRISINRYCAIVNSFLRRRLGTVNKRLSEIDSQRRRYDSQRSEVMELLTESVALDTFLGAQRSLAEFESVVATLEQELEAAVAIGQIDDTIRITTAETIGAVRAEITEREPYLEAPIALFGELGSEIYKDRAANLLISTSPHGLLHVEPSISGDASEGIRSVETFLMDVVCAISGVEGDRSPGLLVHDSHLFDSVDGRQVASCLNIGARLADQHSMQYIVTMNSDFLSSVMDQSDGAFDGGSYELATRLTDSTESGGLFGFRFE